MEQADFPRSHFTLSSEHTGFDFDEDELLSNEEEDENTRHFTEVEKERCPNCNSSFIEPYKTKEGLRVYHCKGCDALLCPRCLRVLEKAEAADGRKTLRCPKCGILS